MHKYKAILFDLDNTLLNYSQSELNSMKQTIQEHQLFVEDDRQWQDFWEIYLKHNSKHWMNFVNKTGTHQSIQQVISSSFQDTLNLEAAVHETLTNTYWSYFCNTCIYEEGAPEVLHSISSQYTLGIISNGIGHAQRQRLTVGNIHHLFESIIVSDEVGVKKPSKEIFELSLNELGYSNREVLFVGDSLSDDYHGAQNAGIDFCFYNRSGLSLANEYDPKYTVGKLQELLELL